MLLRLFTRLDALPNILMWSQRNQDGTFCLSYVELPNLQLNYRTVRAQDELRLVSVEMPHLHVYSPLNWDDEPELLRIVDQAIASLPAMTLLWPDGVSELIDEVVDELTNRPNRCDKPAALGTVLAAVF